VVFNSWLLTSSRNQATFLSSHKAWVRGGTCVPQPAKKQAKRQLSLRKKQTKKANGFFCAYKNA
jgi:hypothetical protein